jgi:hypothetical protein
MKEALVIQNAALMRLMRMSKLDLEKFMEEAMESQVIIVIERTDKQYAGQELSMSQNIWNYYKDNYNASILEHTFQPILLVESDSEEEMIKFLLKRQIKFANFIVMSKREAIVLRLKLFFLLKKMGVKYFICDVINLNDLD